MLDLLTYFNTIQPLSSSLESHLPKIIKRFSYRKDETILHMGQICRKIAFIKSGLVRSRAFRDDEEVTIQLWKEGDIFFDAVSFLDQEPSEVDILAIENCAIEGIGHDDLKETLAKFLEFSHHQRIIQEKAIGKCVLINRLLTRMTPEHRYRYFKRRERALMSRVPLEYIASYLDMDLEMLSHLHSQN